MNKNRICIGCGELINPKRIEILPHTRKCTSCSDTTKVVGHITQESSGGEDTFNELKIMDQETYKKAFPYRNYEKGNTLDAFTNQ